MLKKKIYFILPGFGFGGAERVISIIANNLNYDKFNVSLILFNQIGFDTSRLSDKVNIIDFKVSRIRNAIFKLILKIIKDKPDVVVGGWGEVSAYISLFIPIIKLCISKNILFISRETNIVSKHVNRKDIMFFYKFYNNFDYIISQSDDMTNDLICNINIFKQKIVKINNPVDFDLINNSIECDLGYDIKFKTHIHKKIIAIGTLCYRKGFDLLLEVMKYINDENIILYILGDGPWYDKLYNIIDSNNMTNVVLLGRVNNPYKYLIKSDLFILSSRYEGFPNVLLEAGACGIYSLCNNCLGGINEIIQSGINGEIYDIKEYKKFAKKILDTLHSEKVLNKDVIRQSIFTRFDKNKILDNYVEIFERN